MNSQIHSQDKPSSMSEIASDSSPLISLKQQRQSKRMPSLMDLSSMLPSHFSRNAESYQGFSKSFVQSASSLSKQFSALVNTSTGREKVLAIFQYWGEFQCCLARNSNIPGVQDQAAKKMLTSVRFMFQLKENLSQARKTFRLLKFLDDFKCVSQVIQTKKPFLFKLLGILSHYCSFMYYVTDNILFSINLLVQSRILPKEREGKWKDHKNSFSLLRILFSITRHLWSLFMHHKKERDLYRLITEEESDDVIKKEAKIHELCERLVKQRRKRRMEWMELTIDVSRFFMLFQSLKLPGYRIVDPVFIGFCGVLSSTMSLMKMIIDKKIFASADGKKDGVSLSAVVSEEAINIEKRQGLVDLDGILGNFLHKRHNQQHQS